jgi:hypothetical protein
MDKEETPLKEDGISTTDLPRICHSASVGNGLSVARLVTDWLLDDDYYSFHYFMIPHDE